MKYELLKRLKDAEFPQNAPFIESPEYQSRFLESMKTMTVLKRTEDDYVSDPTLEELIDALGDIHFTYRKIDGRYFVRFPDTDDGHGNEYEFWLHSLKEIFALLWLELNEK